MSTTDSRIKHHLLVSPGSGHLYLRFPYDPHLTRFINERLSDPTYIEGTTNSAIPVDGRPLPASAKPMLYRIGHPDTYPSQEAGLLDLIRHWGFNVNPLARAALDRMKTANHNRLTFGTAHPDEKADLFRQVTEVAEAADYETTTPSPYTPPANQPPLSQSQQPAQSQQPEQRMAPAGRRPDITALTGRTPDTAQQITVLKIQLPRPDDDDQLTGDPTQSPYYQIRDPDGVYDTLMAYPGSQWVKGKKGQYRGYFRVTITHDTPKMIAELRQKHGLLLHPSLPKGIADRIRVLHRDLQLSRTASADLQLPVPDGLDYLPYQKAGIAYAVRKGNALIADEPGLGKTIQAVGVSNALRNVRRVLLVTPASLKINWAREWQKWCVKGLSVGQVAGGKPDQWPVTDNGTEPNVVIINYDLIEKHFSRLTQTPWDLMVVDEAHALKNDKTKRTRLILGAGAKEPGIPRHRTLLLTGTPILSRPKEIWTLAHALDPDYFNNKLQFSKRYCNGHQTDHGWNMDGASNLKELQRELRARIMVRRRKTDVLKDLPPKTRQIIPLSNDSVVRREQRAFQDAARKLAEIRQQKANLELQRNSGQRERDAEAYLAAARNLQDMQKAVFERLSLERKETAIAKVPQVMELVEQGLENTGVGGKPGKVILFAHHKEVIEAYIDALNAYFQKKAKEQDRARPFRPGQPKSPPTQPATVSVVSGQTPNTKRQLEADRFQTDPNCRVFLGSIGAAGVGLTLTEANLVIFGELDWVPGNMSQAEDRAHRIGQLDNVLVWHAVVDGSIDARMVRRLIEKQEVLDDSLDADTGTTVPANPCPKSDSSNRTSGRPSSADLRPPGATATEDQAFQTFQAYLAFLDRSANPGYDSDTPDNELADALSHGPDNLDIQAGMYDDYAAFMADQGQ